MKISDLTEIEELKKILGYEDNRSLKRWCLKHRIPIISIGAKKYILSQYLTQVIDNQLVIFVEPNNDKIKIANKNITDKKSTLKIDNKTYCPTDEITTKYLSKYESASKTYTTKKTAA